MATERELYTAFNLVINNIESRIRGRLEGNQSVQSYREMLISMILRNRDILEAKEPRIKYIDPYEGRPDPEWA